MNTLTTAAFIDCLALGAQRELSHVSDMQRTLRSDA
jgi:hypothetical protein